MPVHAQKILWGHSHRHRYCRRSSFRGANIPVVPLSQHRRRIQSLARRRRIAAPVAVAPVVQEFPGPHPRTGSARSRARSAPTAETIDHRGQRCHATHAGILGDSRSARTRDNGRRAAREVAPPPRPSRAPDACLPQRQDPDQEVPRHPLPPPDLAQSKLSTTRASAREA